jgi:hypothetical protein
VTPGNVELVQVLVSWTVALPLSAATILIDERRLPPEMLASAWPPQSRDAALFAGWMFGVPEVAVAVHFIKTRHWLGVVLGVAAAVAVFALDLGAQIGAAAAIEWLGL